MMEDPKRFASMLTATARPYRKFGGEEARVHVRKLPHSQEILGSLVWKLKKFQDKLLNFRWGSARALNFSGGTLLPTTTTDEVPICKWGVATSILRQMSSPGWGNPNPHNIHHRLKYSPTQYSPHLNQYHKLLLLPSSLSSTSSVTVSLLPLAASRRRRLPPSTMRCSMPKTSSR